MQALGDSFGNVSIIGLRDCSMQRNNQKVIEEAPAQSLSPETKDKLSSYASLLLKEVKYQNAATVEFLVKNDEVYFLEVNSRLQVEHPVTETITGIDLVRAQIKIAQGESLSQILTLPIKETGHSIELRICAEDEKFISSTGRILTFSFPHDIRLDAGFCENNFVTSEYDSMIAKIIVHGSTREEAILKAEKALQETTIFGIKTNIPFLKSLLSQSSFREDSHHIKTVSLLPYVINPNLKFIALAAYFASNTDNDFSCSRSFAVDNDVVDVSIKQIGDDIFINSLPYTVERISAHHIKINHHIIHIKHLSSQRSLCLIDGVHFELSPPIFTYESTSGGDVISPLPGKIISISVKNGDVVKKGDSLLFIESMKMEHPIKAPHDGIVQELNVSPGDAVQNRAILCKVKAQ